MNSIPQLLKLHWIQAKSEGTPGVISFACQGTWIYKMDPASPNMYFRILMKDAFRPEPLDLFRIGATHSLQITMPMHWEPVDVCGNPLRPSQASCTPKTLIPPAMVPPSAQPHSIDELFNPAELLNL
jgi:hypothetical protein